MWENIGSSSAVLIGAIVLFSILVAVLYMIERGQARERKAKPYIVQRPYSENTYGENVTPLRQNTDSDALPRFKKIV